MNDYEIPLTQELKNKWIISLKSEKYKQGGGNLKKFDDYGKVSYCCLGVLCDVIDPTKWELSKEFKQVFQYNGSRSSISNIIISPQIQTKLIEFNDHKGKSFEQIADWIEENIKVEDDSIFEY